jgi:DNA-binding transcriptional ArsR family regulator
MLVAAMDAQSLARIRLAPSPIVEVLSWLELTARGGRHALFGDPGPEARFALRDRDVSLLARSLQTTGYVPDLLTPKPIGAHWQSSWQDQLERVDQAVAADVVSQVSMHRDHPPPADVRDAVEAGTFARRAAQGMRRFHDIALAERWHPVQEAMNDDLAHRSQVILTHGLGWFLSSLHHNLRWTGTHLAIATRATSSVDKSVDLSGAEVVLVPSVLNQPRVVMTQVEDPHDAFICYPVPDRALRQDREQRSSGLPEILGQSRAAIFNDLDVPRSTTELSRRHGLSASTISHHLGLLRRAGLLHRVRDGATVRYSRTGNGNAMAGMLP